MKPKIVILFILPVFIAAIVGWRLGVFDLSPSPTAAARNIGAAARKKDSLAAANYIAQRSDGAVLLNESDPAAQNEIGQWEQRIRSYAQDREAKAAESAQVHALAVKTASLLRMLREASARRKAGQEPYTAESGFNAMTLVMTMEKEFKEVLGLDFADFLNSFDDALIKGLAQ